MSMCNWRHRRGMALIIALGVMLMVSLIGLTVISVSLSSRRMAARRQASESAFQIAEAGLSQAIDRIRENGGSTYSGEGPTAFGDGEFRVTATAPSGFPSRRQLIAYGQVSSVGGSMVTRRVGALVDLQSPIWNYGVITEKTLSLSGNLVIDSAPITGRGQTHSNQDAALSNGVLVDGDLSAAGTTSVSGATVTGKVQSRAARVPFPRVDEVWLRSQATTLGTTVGNVSYSSGTCVLGGVLVGDLKLSSSARLVIDRILWVTGSVDLSGWSYAGDGVLIAEGPIHLSGGDGFTGSESSNLAIIGLQTEGSKSAAITIDGQAKVRGGLFAPKGTVSLSGQTTIFGSLAARQLSGTGQAHITCNTAFLAPLQLSDPRVRYWQEL